MSNQATDSANQIKEFQFHSEELAFLESQGFATNPFNQGANSVEQVWEIQDKLFKRRDGLSYQIDGLVVKLNDNKLTQALGVVGKTPRGWCAVKFQAEETTTKILDITWQVGKTGRVTPVADLEPAQLAGTTVKRASLHNYKEVVESGLRKGDMVVLHKAGDIIPEVVKILTNLRTKEIELNKPFDGPKNCPSCGVSLSLSETEVDLVCTNDSNCPAQILGRLTYFCQRGVGNITGLSEKNLERFLIEFGVKDIADLYDLPYDKIRVLEGFGDKSVQNLQAAVEKARNLTPARFLAGLNIDGVGQENGKLVWQVIQDKAE